MVINFLIIFFIFVSKAIAFQLPPQPFQENSTETAALIVHFNEGAGTVVKNYANTSDGTISGNGVWVTGYMGGALNLGTANGDRVEFGDIRGSDFSGNSTFTYITIRRVYSETSAEWIDKGNSPAWNIRTFQVQAGDLVFQVDEAGTLTKWGTAGNFFSGRNLLNKWVCYILVFVGDGAGRVTANRFRFYANGERITWALREGSEPRDFIRGGNNLVIGNVPGGGVANKCDCDIDSEGIYTMDMTGGTDAGARALTQKIMGDSELYTDLP